MGSLIKHGLLVPTTIPRPWLPPRAGRASRPSWGTHDSPAALPPIPKAALRWYAPALIAILIVLVIRDSGPQRLRFARLRAVSTQATLRRRVLDPVTATSIVRAVRRTGRLIPARVACLEESAAVMLILGLLGYGADWKHGVAVDPVRLHAWVEVDGQPIEEAADIVDYTPFEE
nr:lasso peptide biosynthesis B2 protein [Spiractinospora alimapuensis]